MRMMSCLFGRMVKWLKEVNMYIFDALSPDHYLFDTIVLTLSEILVGS